MNNVSFAGGNADGSTRWALEFEPFHPNPDGFTELVQIDAEMDGTKGGDIEILKADPQRWKAALGVFINQADLAIKTKRLEMLDPNNPISRSSFNFYSTQALKFKQQCIARLVEVKPLLRAKNIADNPRGPDKSLDLLQAILEQLNEIYVELRNQRP